MTSKVGNGPSRAGAPPVGASELGPRARGVNKIGTGGTARAWLRRILAVAVLLLLLWQGWYAGWVLWWRHVDPGQTRFMAMRLKALREQNPQAQLQQRWLPYEKISLQLKQAVVAAEDDRFIDHGGFDWEGMRKALEKNQRNGKLMAGGSTISQQLAKNLFLSAEKTPWRKAQEAVITLWLELFWSKRRILEVYLNVVEWGNGIFGAEAAAHRYFGIGAAQLPAGQAARLAVMLPAPRKFERNPYSDYLEGRTRQILGRMQHSMVP